MSANSPTYALPWIVIIAVAVGADHLLVRQSYAAGLQVYAIGSNPVAAPLRGIPVTAVTLAVFSISGALAGLAGIMYASRWGVREPVQHGRGL